MLNDCGLHTDMNPFRGDYSFSLSSDDLLEPELPLISQGKSGTIKKISPPEDINWDK